MSAGQSSQRRRRTAVAALGVCSALAVGLVSRALHAQPSPPVETPQPEVDRATLLYEEGSQLLRARRAAQALPRLEESMRLLSSPNTELLIAHALRDLNRDVEAMLAYERVVASAGARVRAGEERYQPTLLEAGRWIALERSQLSELQLVVVRARPGTRVEVDGHAVHFEHDTATSTARYRGWHEPGPVRVAATSASGVRREASGHLDAGGAGQLRIDLDAEPVEPPPQAPSPAGLLAAKVALAVGVVGAGVFIGFGIDAESSASELRDCEPSCPRTEELLDTANRGQRSATIANIGLAVGGAGLLASGVIWLVATDFSGSTRTAGARRWSVGVAGTQALGRVSF
ncbi:MAG: hypothetical protein WKG00_01910 [Polyangiaceae bacterium]